MSAFASHAHRYTVDEVMRLVELGVFEDFPRVELLEGHLVDQPVQGKLQGWTMHHVADRLRALIGPAAVVLEEAELFVDDHSLPEPDVVVLRPGRRLPPSGRPTASDGLLVVEIALSSLEVDRAKAELYARGGVGTYWLLDLVSRELVAHDEPSREGYRRKTTLGSSDALVVPGSGRTVTVADLLG